MAQAYGSMGSPEMVPSCKQYCGAKLFLGGPPSSNFPIRKVIVNLCGMRILFGYQDQRTRLAYKFGYQWQVEQTLLPVFAFGFAYSNLLPKLRTSPPPQEPRKKTSSVLHFSRTHNPEIPGMMYTFDAMKCGDHKNKHEEAEILGNLIVNTKDALHE